MTNFKTVITVFFILCVSCSSNKQYTEKISAKLKADAMGLDLNYKSLEFKFTDTLTVKEQIKNHQDTLSAMCNEINAAELLAPDYLTKEKLIKLRNQEQELRSDNNYYDKYVFTDEYNSEWIIELRTQLNRTDSLISIFDALGDCNTGLWKNVIWYNIRRANYYENDYIDYWNYMLDKVKEADSYNNKLDSLNNLSPDNVIHYKAFNRYQINNPFVNNTLQEIEAYIYFDENLNIIEF